MVELDKREPLPFRFEEREGLYRAQHEEFVKFYAWKGPGNEGGFGGSVFLITMQDGTKRKLLGPWSSRAGACNSFFPDRDPVVDCIGTDRTSVVCTVAALEKFGIKFKRVDNGDVRYVPIKE